MKPTRRSAAVITTIAATGAALIAASGMLAASASAAPNASASFTSHAFIGPLHHTKVVASTVPANGDVNPYGVAVVPRSTGNLDRGDVLVSNFNNAGNTQGTGTTIIRQPLRGPIAPPMSALVFFASPLQGLSTALGALRGGFVVVGNVPTTDGTIATIGAGALQVINRHGKVVQTWTDPVLLDGPWAERVVKMKLRLGKSPMVMPIAKCFSRRNNGISAFLADLESFDPQSQPPPPRR